MAKKLGNYVLGKWTNGKGKGKDLFDAVTGQVVATASTDGIDLTDVLAYGREHGSALAKMTFWERGNMLKKLALHLNKKKEDFYALSYRTGATRLDSWIDLEGGFGNLFANASLRKKFPNQTFDVEGDPIDLSRGGRFMAHHILVPKEGVAVHINAFNFPVWGMLEKCACNWMAGVPAVVKPATATSYLTEAVVREIIASGILPEGALQLICGSARSILDGVESQDVVTFTGSASTGRMLKAHKRVIDEAVPFNMEADSLNCIVLGKDAQPGTPEFKLFIKEISREMTVKSGQKCTAIRRVFVPKELTEEVGLALGQTLDKITIGDPKQKLVRMGALASMDQVEEVREKVGELSKTAEIIYGDLNKVKLHKANAKKGAFLSPIVMYEDRPKRSKVVHDVEAFGPVCTIMPYKDISDAIDLAKRGKGSLVCSIATNDDEIAKEFVVGAASHHGRILVINRDSAKQSTGHGSPLPSLVHGGPGRAGGGEEMGGMRGVKHFMQRTAIQGSPTTISAITGIFQQGADYKESVEHPFKYHFEDLEVGQSLLTHNRTVTDTDIINFGNVSWDHFYAHTDITSLQGSIFEKRTAHGYFILSAAAGLFVYPNKGPVAANYGLDQCRFLKPIYHNDTIQVRLTCKEKLERDVKGKEYPAGVVKWSVEVFDQTGELAAMATILTLVQKKSPFVSIEAKSLQQVLSKLTSKHKAAWGKMKPLQMVEHLIATYDVSMNTKNKKCSTPEERIEKFQEWLWNYRPMPKNYQHPGHKKGKLPKAKFSDLKEAIAALLEKQEEYENWHKENPEIETMHHVYGMLDKQHWDLMHTKHFNHHFHQFDLI